MDCIFCQIAAGKIPGDIVYQDQEIIAFRDINPQAPRHLIIIPRKHIPSLTQLSPADINLVGQMVAVANQLAEKEVKLAVTDATKDFLGDKGYSEEYGARPLRRVIQNMVEDRLSEAVLREEFKKFERVYAVKCTVKKTELIARIFKDINEIPDILSVEKEGEGIDIFANKSIKDEVEKIVKEHFKEGKGKLKDTSAYRITENAYVSYVVVDVKDDDILIESKDNFPLPKSAVGAVTA